MLPAKFKQLITLRYQARTADYFDFTTADGEAFSRMIQHPEFPKHVDYALGKIVGWPAFTQSIKGFLTAGFVPAVRYAARKLRKSIYPSPPPNKK
jgi:3-methyladenine DNA glycosylase AlkD